MMWRLTFVRDWWNHQLDRFVDRRIRRASDRVHEGFTRLLTDNARHVNEEER